MLFLLPAAFASPPVFTDSGIVLRAPDDGTWAWGIGAPSVEWDGTQYVMYFESDIGPASGCPTRYVIGRATSPDGVAWVIDAAPVLSGNSGDARSHWYCGASQPAVAFDGTTWHLAFMENEYTNEGRPESRASYLGYATSTDGVSFTVVEDAVGTVARGMGRSGGSGWWPVGFPSVVLADGEVNILYATYAGFGYARSGATVGLRQTFYALDGDLAADGRWVYSPSGICDNDPASVFRTLFLARYREDAPSAVWTENEAMWMDSRELESVDGTSMHLFTAVRHADLLQVGESDAVLWYTTFDELGRRAVGYAATTATPGIPLSRSCDVDFAEGDDFPEDVLPPPDTGTPRDWPPPGSAEIQRGDTGAPDSGGDTGGDTTGDSGGDSGSDSGADSATDTGGDTANDSGGDTGGDSAQDSGGETGAPIDMGNGKGTGCGPSGGVGCASAAVAPGWALLLGLAAMRRRRVR